MNVRTKHMLNLNLYNDFVARLHLLLNSFNFIQSLIFLTYQEFYLFCQKLNS